MNGTWIRKKLAFGTDAKRKTGDSWREVQGAQGECTQATVTDTQCCERTDGGWARCNTSAHEFV
jgi:hypothetical protein